MRPDIILKSRWVQWLSLVVGTCDSCLRQTETQDPFPKPTNKICPNLPGRFVNFVTILNLEKSDPSYPFAPPKQERPSYQPLLPLFASTDVSRLKQNPQRACRWMALRHKRPTFKNICCFIFQKLLLFTRAENNCNFAITVVAPPAPPDLSKSQKNEMLLLQWVPLDTFPTQHYSVADNMTLYWILASNWIVVVAGK